MTDEYEDVRVLEALLFASREPMSVNDMVTFFNGRDAGYVRTLLGRLRQDYDGRGIGLEESEGRWAFRTAPDLSERLHTLRTEDRKLSRAGMETLAVIAYHQPITRAEIEAVRGVATAKGTVDALLETGWIKPGRRRETPGRPLTWVTTPAFLDHFGLQSIVDLPGLDDLRAAGLLDRRPQAAVTPDMFAGVRDAGDETTDDDHESDDGTSTQFAAA